MKLYLLRHGIADWPNWDRPDDERPLTEKGKKKMRRMAKFLRDLEVRPALILSSPLPRAWQTAEIAAEFLEVELQREDALSKGFTPAQLRKIIARAAGRDLMIVGHEPGFGIAIRALTGGDVKLAKGGLALIDLDEEAQSGRLVWLLPPKVAR